MMKSKLLEFLEALAKDPRILGRYFTDPKLTMDEFGLTDEESSALMSGETDAIRNAIGIPEDEFVILKQIWVIKKPPKKQKKKN